MSEKEVEDKENEVEDKKKEVEDKEKEVQDIVTQEPLSNEPDNKRNSLRSKDSEIVIGELNKIIRMKNQMKKKKLEVQEKAEKAKEKIPHSPITGNKNYIDLKAQFTAQLTKLNSLDTRQAALKELESIIQQNKTPESLRVYFSAISEYNRPQNFSINEAEVFLLGLICDSYGTSLLDAQDNPPNLFNACIRIGELIGRYFKDENESVQRQCCKTWKQLYQSQLLNQPLKNKMKVLYEIPASIISGGKDRVAQITSVMIIESVLEFAEKVSDKELVMAIAKKYLSSIYLKLFLDTPSLVGCARLIVSTVEIKTQQSFINQIIEKTLSFLIPQESRPIQYKIRIEVLDFLTVIARQLQDIASSMKGQYQDQIIPILQECTKDRMLKVQKSAKQALKEWQVLKQKIEKLERKKLTSKAKMSNEYIDSEEIMNSKTAEAQDQVHQLKRHSKQQVRTIIIENDNGMKNVLNKQGGWVNELKAKNFIRKQTGIGGGRIVLNESRLKIQKTAINQQKRVRNLILGQYKDFRDDFKQKKIQQQEQNDYDDIPTHQKRKPTQNEQENQIQNQTNNAQKRQMQDNITILNENVSNNFYNSQLQNLQVIQKSQQQLIEEQLKLYPHNSLIENRHFIVPPQKNYPTQINEKYDTNSSFTRQRYKESQPEFLIVDQTPQQSYFFQKNQVDSTKFNQNMQQDMPFQSDTLEDTQDFNEINFKEKINIINSFKKQKFKSISELWENAIQLADEGKIDEAFEIVLDSDDNIYFIRLLMRTGVQIEKLKRNIAIKAIHKYLLIQKSNFVNKLCFEFYQDSIDSGLQDQLLIEDQKEMHDTIDELSHSSNQVTRSIANNILSQTYTNRRKS